MYPAEKKKKDYVTKALYLASKPSGFCMTLKIVSLSLFYGVKIL